MSSVFKLYDSTVRHFYNGAIYRDDSLPEWRRMEVMFRERSFVHAQLEGILRTYGVIEFLVFLYDFVRAHGVVPIFKDREGQYPACVAQMLADTSVDITDKAAILAIEKLIQ
jgi:hypothetical protein